eukprot:CAMPEP_0197000552 /NCGR_PEP_ID=MMETSP1380-20130617/5461_1 /TAXON_ID=5936 /ORGANISM="Euplotes crassus, Strain CT5" /LENGTH=291 /DNA_ID=CAMNT_0042417879 /DNA_START=102 /DNA_END=977 /DNA_ORIENTATION=+
MKKRISNKIAEAYGVLSNQKKKAHYDLITRGRYDSVNINNQTKDSKTYYKATETYTRTYGSNQSSSRSSYSSEYTGNYYENLKRDHYQYHQAKEEKNMLAEVFLKAAAAIAVLCLLKGLTSNGGGDKHKNTAKPESYHPFATTTKLNDEKYPYKAMTRPGGPSHTTDTQKEELKLVLANPKQYLGERKVINPTRPYTNQIPVMVPAEAQAFKSNNSFKNSKNTKKKKSTSKSGKKGTKLRKKDLSEGEVPYFVPIVGPVILRSSGHKIKIVGSITNMRHERQPAGYKVIKQ